MMKGQWALQLFETMLDVPVAQNHPYFKVLHPFHVDPIAVKGLILGTLGHLGNCNIHHWKSYFLIHIECGQFRSNLPFNWGG